jgi:prophage regulatory protein
MEAVLDRTGLSRSSLYDLVAKGDFRRPVKIIGNVNGWPSDEVDSWIAARLADREAA